MKILNFPDDTTIFLLRDINCHTTVPSILKPHEKVSSSKTNVSNIQDLWARAYKPGQTRQMIWSQLYIKILGIHFVNSTLDNNIWDK